MPFYTGFMWHFLLLTTTEKHQDILLKQLAGKAKLIASFDFFFFDTTQMGFCTKGLFTIISFQQLALEQHENTINTKVYHNSDSQQMKFTIPTLHPLLIECCFFDSQFIKSEVLCICAETCFSRVEWFIGISSNVT